MNAALVKQREVFDLDTADRQVKKSQAKHLPGMLALQSDLDAATGKVAKSVGR